MSPDADDPQTPTADAAAKQPLKLDFDKLLRTDETEPTAEIVVLSSGDRRRLRRRVKTAESESCSTVVDESLSQKHDGDLNDQIERLTKFLNNKSMNLPDNGVKIKLQLERLFAEKDRRLLRLSTKVVDGCSNPGQGRGKLNGDLDGPNQAAQPSRAPESSEFNNFFRKKLENVAKPGSEQNAGVKMSYAFQDEISCLKQCDNRKRNAAPKLTQSKKAKSGKGSKQFSAWNHSNDSRLSRGRQKYGQLNKYLSSRPLSQDKLPGLFTIKNDSNGFGSTNAIDDKEECTVVLVDEEEPEADEKIKEPEKRRSRGNECKIFYPTREDPDSLEIFRSELRCLEPGECLTSTIMNFYIRFLQQLYSTSDTSKMKFYFFNTYFYSKLQEAVARQNDEAFFIKFRRWWKGVNLFEKTYIFLPVNEDKHWSLIIICISDEEDSGPVMLHLDSLGLHCSSSIFKNVKSLLENEWNFLKEDGEALRILIPDTMKGNLPEMIEGIQIEAPRQTNDYDCGLFVLYYLERFIQDAPEKMKGEHLSKFGKKWFKAQEASSLRGRIKKILQEEFQKAPTPSEDNSLYESVCLSPIAKTAKISHHVDVS